jgi:3-keto-L-gulonate-6-phosphate decarboxylase
MSIAQLMMALVRVLEPREATVEGLKFVDAVDKEVAMFAEEVSGCLFVATMRNIQTRAETMDACVEVHVEAEADVRRSMPQPRLQPKPKPKHQPQLR